MEYFQNPKLEEYKFRISASNVLTVFNSLSVNLTKCSNTHAICQQQLTNCLGVFDYFVGFALKGLKLTVLSNKQTFHINRFAFPPEKREYSVTCLYCQHGLIDCNSNYSAIFKSGECKVPLCRRSKGNCCNLQWCCKKRYQSNVKDN